MRISHGTFSTTFQGAEEPGSQALEPAFTDEAVREVAAIGIRAAEERAQLDQCQYLLPTPLEVQDDPGLILGECPIHGCIST
jgi:hypothetical protein